jgi:serine/threonine protein kinase
MDYIPGRSLTLVIGECSGPQLFKDTLGIVRQVCQALNYTHRKGVVHGDVKPGNILLDEHGKAYLTDFGIFSKITSYDDEMTIAGTPAYMAQGLVQGRERIPQTEIYSMCIVLYEMITGENCPFNGDNTPIDGTKGEKVRWEQVMLNPPPPSQFNHLITPPLESIVLKFLEKHPSYRHRNAEELLSELESALKGGNGDDNGIVTNPKARYPKKGWRYKQYTGILFAGEVLSGLLVLGSSYVLSSVNSKRVLATHHYDNHCMHITVSEDPKVLLDKCVVSVTIFSNGVLRICYAWRGFFNPLYRFLTIKPDTFNEKISLKDNLDNRIMHINTRGGINRSKNLHNEDSKNGWFEFSGFDPKTEYFIFVDGNQNKEIPRI